MTVVWNGTTVHNGAPESPGFLPIRLQDHGDPGANVRYRTIWVEPG